MINTETSDTVVLVQLYRQDVGGKSRNKEITDIRRMTAKGILNTLGSVLRKREGRSFSCMGMVVD